LSNERLCAIVDFRLTMNRLGLYGWTLQDAYSNYSGESVEQCNDKYIQ